METISHKIALNKLIDAEQKILELKAKLAEATRVIREINLFLYKIENGVCGDEKTWFKKAKDLAQDFLKGE